MTLRATTALALTAALLLAACRGGHDDDPGSGGRSDDDTEEATTTTTVPAAYRSVVDARLEVQSQYEQARANPTNPENPALRDHFTGVELLNLIRGQVFNNDGNGNGVGTRYPENSQHRFEIESVTFSDADPKVAWLETCWLDDGVDTYLRTGSTAAMSIFEIPPVRTVQRTEEMRNEGGHWKLARTFTNSYEEGATGCATDDDYEQPYTDTPASDGLTRTITESRQAAEQAYVTYLTSQVPTGVTEHWTGFQAVYFFTNTAFGDDNHKNPDGFYCPSDVTLIATSATSNEYVPFYLQDAALNPWNTDPYYGYPQGRLNESPCYKDYQLGQNAWSFLVANDGRTFDPTTTSTVVVQTVQMQSIGNPHVAYLTTCRTFNLVPTGEAPDTVTQGSVTATEVMHLVDGKWKVSNRWGFTRAESCG